MKSLLPALFMSGRRLRIKDYLSIGLAGARLSRTLRGCAGFRAGAKSHSVADAAMFPPDLLTRAADLIARYRGGWAHGHDRGIVHRRSHRRAL